MDDFLKYVLDNHTQIDKKLHEKLVNRLLVKEGVDKSLEWLRVFQSSIVGHFMMYQEIEEFKEEHLILPNGEVNRLYEYIFNLDSYPNLTITKIEGIEVLNLTYNSDTKTISGVPNSMTSTKIDIYFSHKKEAKESEEIKAVYLMVNANPRNLWKDLASDSNGAYAQSDAVARKGVFLDKKVVGASKRGRSHAHIGSYRDDSFGFADLCKGWSLIAVADGAGSAQYARQGAQLATSFIERYFNNEELLDSLEYAILEQYNLLNEDIGETEILMPSKVSEILSGGVTALFAELETFADTAQIKLDDMHSTLAFTLCKKYASGYLILSFSVGDCPIVVFSKDNKTVKVLNTLDVGEFGGGTRFVTMSEIYQEPLSKRLNIHFTPSFSHLFLMSDGIYDPKFGTENNLDDLVYWNDFILDLDGQNEDQIKVNLVDDLIADEELLLWMDFWSKGNHDDRTLVIVY